MTTLQMIDLKYILTIPSKNKNNKQNKKQYAHNGGVFALRETLLSSYKQRFLQEKENKLDQSILSSLTINNIQITNGCAGALDASFMAFLNEGDEVVTIEPYFDFYKYQIGHRKATIKTVSLDLVKRKNNNNKNKNDNTSEYEFSFDASKLERVFTNKTRMLVLNSPHNPTGYVMDLSTMKSIAKMLEKYPNILILTDEVYEHIVFDNCKHYHFACLPNMWHRTITVSSAAKTFSVTGWKIGWAIGDVSLIKNINYAARGVTWCVSTPMQNAVNEMLNIANKEYKGFKNYYQWLSNMYEKKRNLIIQSIIKLGMKPIIPNGAFYIIADANELMISKMNSFDFNYNKNNINFDNPHTFKDWQFAWWLIDNLKVATIPVSAFLDFEHLREYNKNTNGNANNTDENVTDLMEKGFDLIRFCFCVTDETIQQTATRAKLMAKL